MREADERERTPRWLYGLAACGGLVIVGLVLFVVTDFLVVMQHKVISGRSYATVAGKAFRPRSLDLGPWRWLTLGLAVVYLLVVVVLPTLALVITAFQVENVT